MPAGETTMAEESVPPEAALPFVAPCRTLAAAATLGWLQQGWRDMWSAPRQSLTYGTIVVLLSLALAGIAVKCGGYWELLALMSGSSWSHRARRGHLRDQRADRARREALAAPLPERRAPRFGNLMVFALMLMVCSWCGPAPARRSTSSSRWTRATRLARVRDILRHRQRRGVHLRGRSCSPPRHSPCR